MSENSMKKHEELFELAPEYDFSQAERGRFYIPKKISTTMRLDDDIIIYFKKWASEKKTGYQTLINNALREFIREQGPSYTPRKPSS